MELENELKLARVKNGDLTQQELAELVSCSRQTIHSIEKGKFVPSVALALRISRVLNTPIEELFRLKDSK